MPNHIVQQGECLSGIAAMYGFRNFRTLYDHPGNSKLRNLRPDPNLLFPGDVVFVPEKTPKEVSVATTKLHRFQIAAPRRVLRLVLEGLDGKKMASEPYELNIEGDITSGVTGADGLIEQVIPPDAVNGSLTTEQYTWPLSVAHLNPVADTNDKGMSAIQARLRNLGYDPGPIDGINGPRTIEAVKTFQEDNPPLTVDGVCGPKTRALLIQLYGF
jgi:putative peptidoglycan binding protein